MKKERKVYWSGQLPDEELDRLKKKHGEGPFKVVKTSTSKSTNPPPRKLPYVCFIDENGKEVHMPMCTFIFCQ
ncbi:hypothetical protein GOV04_02140 [Candidatus Woesearchaeota archaeon]|nr:hypothetical protein [Candidatus Woesearchaeota archaeon]